jgi:peptide/nickel transport system permease protein
VKKTLTVAMARIPPRGAPGYDRLRLATPASEVVGVARAKRSALRPSRSFLRFLGRRLVALVLLGLGITLVAFVLTQLVPANPVAANLGEQAAADPAAVATFRERYGLDRPLPVQYATYVVNLLQGDLGESQQTRQPVRHELSVYIPATAELALVSILIAAIVGIGLGVVAAMRRNRTSDHVLRVVSLAGISMPTFWLALVTLYVFFFRLNWVPGGDRLDPGVLPPPHKTGLYTVDALLAGDWSTFTGAFHHLVLPALVLAAYNVGLLTRYTRSAVLEVISNDYVRAARAKGLPEVVVVLRHVLRAALPSVITVLGLVFANVLTGAVLVESIFAWPGVGQYAYRSAVTLDLPAIMGVSLFVAIVYITVNFVVDVLYGVIDPRIRTS